MIPSRDWTGTGNSIWRALGASNHSDKEREANDLYTTDPIALDKLSKVFPIAHKVWEPMAGLGHLSDWLKGHGHDVLATDLIDRGIEGIKGGVDFLNLNWSQKEAITQWGGQESFDILTNPAYKIALPTVLKALEYIPNDGHVFMFVKTTFLEGKERREKLYDVNPPRYVFQFSERVLCAKNGIFEYDGKRISSAVSYCWMLWNKHNDEHRTEIKWI